MYNGVPNLVPVIILLQVVKPRSATLMSSSIEICKFSFVKKLEISQIKANFILKTSGENKQRFRREETSLHK